MTTETETRTNRSADSEPSAVRTSLASRVFGGGVFGNGRKPVEEPKPPRKNSNAELSAKLDGIQDGLKQLQRRILLLTVAIIALTIASLDVVGTALRGVLYAAVTVALIGVVYWLAFQRGKRGRRL